MYGQVKSRQPLQRRPIDASKIPTSATAPPAPSPAPVRDSEKSHEPDTTCPFIHVDRQAIHNNLETRIRYLHSFLDFNRDDIDALISGAKYVKALIPTAVDAMYSKLLEYDITAQSFSKTKKEDGEEKLPSEQSSEILRRKIFLRWYLTKLCSDPSKLEYWEYMDKVGRMHIGRDPSHPIHIDYVHIGMTLGFVMDVFIQTLMSHPQVPFGRKLGLLRALSKVMWIQNDLFARWYIRDGHESSDGGSDADTASYDSTRGHHSSGGGGHHHSPSYQSGGQPNGCPVNHGAKDQSTPRTRPSNRTCQKTQSMYSNASHNTSSKALSEASTIARSREDETSSISSAGTATASNQLYPDPDRNNSTTSLESKKSIGQASAGSSTESRSENRSAFGSVRRMLSNSSRRLDLTKKERVDDDSLSIPLIINNEFTTTQKQFDVRNPATGKLVGRCSSASVEDANRAVQAAQTAFRVWSKMQPYARRDLMMRAAEIMLNRKEELIFYQREETGAGRLFAEHTFMLAVSFLKDFASRIPSIEGSVPTVAEEGRYAMVIKEPYGVVLGIVPWNAPYLHGVRVVGLPLAAGNSVVLKGSELAPRCFWAMGDIYREAGLPAGCVNVLYNQTSHASSVTTALISHPLVRKVNFMGSTQVGSVVASIAGRYIKPITLALGGKASAIVLDDANLGKAAMGCIVGSFMHVERIIVQRGVLEKFRRALVETAEKVFEKDAPPPILIAAGAVEKNKGLVANALAKGANILFGDLNSQETSKASMRPLIVENVTPEMEVYFTESFGPTVSLMAVDTEEEAIALANDTEYGLSAAIYTENLFRAIRVGRGLECGSVHINSTTIHDSPGLPHGGWKSSGFGRSGGGSSCYDEFLQTKTITWVEQ
ncbi:hypothetical protein MPDQ_001647 [Monascus purpureus]|uniref:Globin-sensor domain-containing protein n=1 Tax=Monascus purpureus TaxID=5098 RepID=A0A507QM36_MONPU|nr:hypothetical protein MPDQ_001647 [Monascus purpureus]